MSQCLLTPVDNPQPLSFDDARRLLGPGASARDLAQACKLFTCQHGVTLNWAQARAQLKLDQPIPPRAEQPKNFATHSDFRFALWPKMRERVDELLRSVWLQSESGQPGSDEGHADIGGDELVDRDTGDDHGDPDNVAPVVAEELDHS